MKKGPFIHAGCNREHFEEFSMEQCAERNHLPKFEEMNFEKAVSQVAMTW